MKKSVLVILHAAFWVFTALLVLLIFQLIQASSWVIFGSRTAITPADHVKAIGVVLPAGACIFYAAYFSFPFFTKRVVRFGWLVVAMVLLLFAVSLPGYLQEKAALKGIEPNHIHGLLSMTLLISPILYFMVLGFLFKAFVEWIKDRKIKAELERDKMASQLELLQAKLNPHFLFNTLNNIDVFIQSEPVKASDYLRKLSGLLRFMLYDTALEKIPLEKEIDYIQEYIDLQRIRSVNADFVKFEVTGDTAGKTISPMILIHFIENAFKHATNKKITGAIDIRLEAAGNTISFHCKNHIQKGPQMPGEDKGLGILLLKQKLDLLYPGSYTLSVKEENNWYLVHLQIRLNDH
jgi:two-component system, LytTR family, sensor kinase